MFLCQYLYHITVFKNVFMSIIIPHHSGTQGHPYACFPTGLMYVYVIVRALLHERALTNTIEHEYFLLADLFTSFFISSVLLLLLLL